jgi:hypothetical protein
MSFRRRIRPDNTSAASVRCLQHTHHAARRDRAAPKAIPAEAMAVRRCPTRAAVSLSSATLTLTRYQYLTACQACLSEGGKQQASIVGPVQCIQPSLQAFLPMIAANVITAAADKGAKGRRVPQHPIRCCAVHCARGATSTRRWAVQVTPAYNLPAALQFRIAIYL